MVTLVGGTIQLYAVAPAEEAVYTTGVPVPMSGQTFTVPVTTGAAPLATDIEADADTGDAQPLVYSVSNISCTRRNSGYQT